MPAGYLEPGIPIANMTTEKSLKCDLKHDFGIANRTIDTISTNAFYCKMCIAVANQWKIASKVKLVGPNVRLSYL